MRFIIYSSVFYISSLRVAVSFLRNILRYWAPWDSLVTAKNKMSERKVLNVSDKSLISFVFGFVSDALNSQRGDLNYC